MSDLKHFIFYLHKTMKPVSQLVIISAFGLVTACGGGSKATQEADTLAADTAVVVEPVLPLPDTAYASAGKVNARVTVYDTIKDGTVPPDCWFYADAPGVMTFRKDPFRDADFGGKIKGTPTDIVVDWTYTTEADYRHTDFGEWGGGTGWTGQPLYVEWPDSCMKKFKAKGVVNENFGKRELIIGSLACKVYFLNFDTGKPTRKAIPTRDNPIKGTPSLDPTLNGNLYVGQGVPAVRPFGAFVIDLNKHDITDFTPEDPKAIRRWGAYDSSPLRLGDFVFRPGENGILYKYTVLPGKLKLHSTLLYTVGGSSPGMECSMAVYRNYGYVGDNHGHVVCVNLSTMQPVWYYFLGDDIDASPVLAIEDDVPYLYVCCEVDRRHSDDAKLAKLNALDGSEVWVHNTPARRFEGDGKHFDGGYYSTPLLGSGDCKDIIYAHCVLNEGSVRNGHFVAIDRRDGSTVYTTKLRTYGWSSPVSLVNETGKMYVFTGDCWGNVYLIDGKDGKVICRKQVGSNFESSPIVVGNSIVVGSRGNQIFKMTVK